jgi:hypothetical protein
MIYTLSRRRCHRLPLYIPIVETDDCAIGEADDDEAHHQSYVIELPQQPDNSGGIHEVME